MKKSTSQLPQCSMFESLHGTGKFDAAGQSWYGVNLYAVAGRPGLWRRVPRQGGPMSDPAENREGAVAAYWCGSVVALARDLAAEVELLEAGFQVRFGPEDMAVVLPSVPQDQPGVPATAPAAEVAAPGTPATANGNGGEAPSLFSPAGLPETPVSRKRRAATGA